MAQAYKVLIAGPFNAGKTAFIRTISEIPIVSTEERISDRHRSVKDETTVALDYGQARLDGCLLHLYGTPGQARFDFMWDILSDEMDGFVLLLDSTDRGSLLEAKKLIRFYRRRGGDIPYLVAANKQDLNRARSAEAIRSLIGLDEQVPVVDCVAHEGRSVKKVLAAMVGLLKREA